MQIGSHTFDNQIILAPMAGVTDLPFRNLCRELGAGAAVAEMLISDRKLWGSKKSSFRQVQKDETGLRWIQILGNDPEQMADAARACEEQGAHIVDINMGCPAKKVCRKAAGSALMKDERLVEEILTRVVGAVSIPVTLKMRTGWSKEHKNADTIARIAEQSGIAALSVHGRTRACKYDESAEYETVTRLKQFLSIPLILNGDIDSPKKAKDILALSAVDGVMIGRAALGNPWLFREIDALINHDTVISPPDAQDIYSVMFRHVKELHRFYGDYIGARIARKHVSWYQDKFPMQLSIKKQFNQLDSCERQLDLIRSLSLNSRAVAA